MSFTRRPQLASIITRQLQLSQIIEVLRTRRGSTSTVHYGETIQFVTYQTRVPSAYPLVPRYKLPVPLLVRGTSLYSLSLSLDLSDTVESLRVGLPFHLDFPLLFFCGWSMICSSSSPPPPLLENPTNCISPHGRLPPRLDLRPKLTFFVLALHHLAERFPTERHRRAQLSH